MRSPFFLRRNFLLVTIFLVVTCAGRPSALSAAVGADNFANAPLITGSYSTEVLTYTESYTSETGEPDHGNLGMAHSAWWKWVAPASGFCTIETLRTDSIVDTVVAVYTGTKVNSVALVADGDDSAAGFNSSVTFFATAGSLYHIAVDSEAITLTREVLLRLRLVPAEPRRYFGEWSSPDQLTIPSGTGILSFNMTAKGVATGVLAVGPSRYKFKALATANGYLIAAIPRKPSTGNPSGSPITLIVDLAFANVAGFLDAFSVSDPFGLNGTGALSKGGTFTASDPAQWAGNFTIALNLSSATGSGYLRAKITPTGRVTFAGVNGDGQAIAAGTEISTDGTIPFHQAFSGGNGFMTGHFSCPAPNRISASQLRMTYRRAAAGGQFYPNGFTSSVTATGAHYSKPAAGSRALDFLESTSGAGKLAIADAPGELSPVTENLTFSKNNSFAFSSSARFPKLKLNPANGLVTGSITPTAGVPRKLRGVLHLDENSKPRISGFVSGASRTAAFSVVP